jgi:hypothetical protein
LAQSPPTDKSQCQGLERKLVEKSLRSKRDPEGSSFQGLLFILNDGNFLFPGGLPDPRPFLCLLQGGVIRSNGTTSESYLICLSSGRKADAPLHVMLQIESGCTMDVYAICFGTQYRQNSRVWGVDLTPSRPRRPVQPLSD